MIRHEWQAIGSPEGRPHYRCSVCRLLVGMAAGMPKSMQDQHLEICEPCYGKFQVPLFDGPPAANFKAFYLRGLWIKARMPKRSPAEVARLWANCCGPCPERTADRTCPKAKCRVLPCGPPECNMLAWATAGCPTGKFQVTFPETSRAEAVADSR